MSSTIVKQHLYLFYKSNKLGTLLQAVISQCGSGQRTVRLFVEIPPIISAPQINRIKKIAQTAWLFSPLWWNVCHSIFPRHRRLLLFCENSRTRLTCTPQTLSILGLHLQSMVIMHEAKPLSRIKICVGLSATPFLAKVYLGTLGLMANIPGSLLCVWQYDDDITGLTNVPSLVTQFLCKSTSSAPELKFSVELPTAHKLKFLHLTLVCEKGLCWSYGKHTAKPLLLPHGSYSKIIELNIISNLLKSHVSKSCVHHVAFSLQQQRFRLTKARYDRNIMATCTMLQLCKLIQLL